MTDERRANLQRWGTGLMAMGTGFQGRDPSGILQNYRDALERDQRKAKIESLMGRLNISGQQRAILDMLPIEQQPQYLMQLDAQGRARSITQNNTARQEAEKRAQRVAFQNFMTGGAGGGGQGGFPAGGTSDEVLSFGLPLNQQANQPPNVMSAAPAPQPFYGFDGVSPDIPMQGQEPMDPWSARTPAPQPQNAQPQNAQPQFGQPQFGQPQNARQSNADSEFGQPVPPDVLSFGAQAQNSGPRRLTAEEYLWSQGPDSGLSKEGQANVKLMWEMQQARDAANKPAAPADEYGRYVEASNQRGEPPMDRFEFAKAMADAKRGDGTTVYDPVTGKPLVQIGGRNGAMPTDLSVDAGKNTGYLIRTQASNKILDKFEDQGLRWGQQSLEKVPMGLGNLARDSEFQQFDQARRDFINAILRRESGAVISETEFENGNLQYFPVPGDQQPVIDQKRKNRENAIEGIRVGSGAGAAYVDEMNPDNNSGENPPPGVSEELWNLMPPESRALWE
jgi:hypothetical protein